MSDKTKDEMIEEIRLYKKRIAEYEEIIKERKNLEMIKEKVRKEPEAATKISENEARQKKEEMVNTISLLNKIGGIAKVGGWELDILTMTQIWSDETYKIHDVDKNTYNPNVAEEISRFSPKSKPIIDKAVQKVIKYGEPYDLELEMTTVKGNNKIVRAIGIAKECNGKIVKVFGTVQDITEIRRLEKIFIEQETTKISEEVAREYAESIINTVREPLIALDQDLRVVTVSRSFYDFFKVKPEDTVGQLIYDLGNKQWDIPKLRELLETILPQKATFDNYEVEHDFAGVGRRIMLLNARQIERAFGKEKIILLAIEDITERKKDNELLQASEIQYRRLFEAAKDGILMLDAETGDVLDVNPFLINILGYSKKQIQNKKIWEIGFLNDTIGNKDKFLELQQKKYVRYENLPLETADRRRLDVEFVSNVYMAGQRKVIQCNIRDITERKRMESISRLATVVRDSNDAITIQNSEGNISAWNSGAELMFGYSEQEALAMNVWQLVPPNKVAEQKDFNCRIFAGEKVTSFETQRLTKDGRLIDVWMTVTKLMDDAGKVTGIASTERNITERKKAEIKLIESEDRYKRITAGLTDYLYSVSVEDGKAVKTVHNEACLSVTGYTAEEIMSDPYLWINMVVPEDKALVADRINKIFKGIDLTSFEHRIVCKDGEIRWISDIAIPKYDSKGVLVSYDGVIKDITNRKRSEEALRESEGFLSSIIENIPDMIFVKNATDLSFVKFNKAGEDLLGVSRKTLMGNDGLYLFTKEQASYFREKDRAVLNSKKMLDIPEEFIDTKDKGTRVLHTKKIPLLDENGESKYLLVISEDISERKKAEDKIAQLKQQNELILSSAAEGILVLDLQGNQTFVNPAAARMLGYEARELIGLPSHGVWHHTKSDGSPYPKEECSIYAVLHDEVARHVSNEVFWRKNGTSFFVEYDSTPIYEQGRLVGVVVTFEDITDRKRAEKALVASEIRFRELFDNMSNAVAVYEAVDGGEDFVFKDFNSCAEKVERVRREDVLGKRVTEVFPGVREFGYLEIFKKVWITGKMEYLPATLYKDERSLTPSWRENHIYKLPSNEIVAIYEDITERKHLEEQLLQSQKMDAIGTLTGGIAHDFNNLLTVILGNSNIAMSEIDKKSQTYKDIKEINIAATRAALLTRQLLLYSRKQPMRLYALDMNKTINDLVKMLKRLLGEDVKIKLQLEADILSVKADISNLEQVITNLCINARDAMPKGGIITIKTENVVISEDESKIIDNSRPGYYVRLSIADTGFGMDKETIKRIYEPFFTTKGLGKGTGLGLSVVYGIIKAHNGWISVYSEPEHGTIFKVYLPAVKSEAAVISEIKEESGRLKGKGEHILIIEDDEAVLEYIERILLKNNYCIHKAVSAQNAVEVFKENSKSIDLVISDMVLTDETGLDTIDKLKLIKNDIGVIICSGYLDDKANFLEIQEKGYEFIRKPFETIDMLRTIRQMLDGKK